MPLIIYLFTVNVASFLLMLSDKLRAIKKAQRIPESMLLGVAVIGGSVGVIMGMLFCRHKTRHARFRNGLPLIFSIHLAIAFLWFYLK